MKRFLILLLATGVFVSGYAAPKKKESRRKNQETPIVVNNIKIRIAPTPVVRYDNVSNSRSPNGRHSWAVMDVEFLVNKPDNAKTDRAYWFDDVTMEGVMVMLAHDYRNVPKYVVFSGKVRFCSVARDNKNHDAMFAVPGQLLDRYYTFNKGSYPANMFIAGSVTFTDSSGRLLGEGFIEDGSFVKKDTAKVRNLLGKMDKGYSDIVHVRNGLYPKNRTPWAFYKHDRYALINDEPVSGGASGQKADEDNE